MKPPALLNRSGKSVKRILAWLVVQVLPRHKAELKNKQDFSACFTVQIWGNKTPAELCKNHLNELTYERL